jgi:DnaJ-domain-containing protein 1
MSLTRRFMNLARANLNALLDRVGDSDSSSIDALSDEELEAELLRRKARREREEEQRLERAQAERAARERAAASGTGTSSAGGASSSGSGSTGSGSGAGGARPRGAADPHRLAQYYAQLEVPFGADLAEVKAAYRRLMRKYHPDRYPNDPQKAAMATELTQKLAQAYREIETALRDKRPAGKRM